MATKKKKGKKPAAPKKIPEISPLSPGSPVRQKVQVPFGMGRRVGTLVSRVRSILNYGKTAEA